MKTGRITILATMLLLTVGYARAQFSGGDGSATNPYLVSSPDDLDNIRNYRGTLGAPVYYRQTTNITLSGYSNWLPIGTSESAAYVHYDGDGFGITGLAISRSTLSDVGLFGYIREGSVRDVEVGGQVTGYSRVGTLVGYLHDSTLEGCASTGVVTGGDYAVGGLVGFSDHGTISQSFQRQGSASGDNAVGGIAGYMTAGSLTHCYAAAIVNGASSPGGLVGNVASSPTITDCFWDTQVSGQATSAGGGSGLSTAQMMQRAEFGGWDFASVWQLYTGNSYPYLRLLADTVDDPVLDPGSGEYPGSSITVTTACATAGATIHYTTARTTPDDTTTNTVAAGGSVSVTIPATLKTVAWKAYMNPSAVVTNSYDPAPTVATPTVTPEAGSYAGTNLTVTISCATTNAVIRYTIDESGEPDENSAEVPPSGEVTIPLPSTLKAKAWRDDLNTSLMLEAVYDQMPIAATPMFNPDGGTFTDSFVNVTITSATTGATLYYTTNGIAPTTNSSSSVANGGSVGVPVPGTLKAMAWKSGYTESAVKSADYTAAGGVATPVFDPDGGPVAAGFVSVTVTCATPGASIRYTTDGSAPLESSPAVANGQSVSVPVPGTLKAKAWADGLSPSAVESATFTTADVVATPTFTPDGGTGSVGSINVTLSCVTSGTLIHYTTNGLDPTQTAPSVTSGTAVSVPLPSTLKAKAFKTGLFSSPVQIGYYGNFAGGTGTAQDPYRIATAAHLDRVRDDLGAHFVMIADIDLDVAPWNSGAGWLPVDDGGYGFAGTFNGGGHVVSNLYIARSTADWIGLFGYVGASGRIFNLGIVSGSVSGKNYVGGIAGTNVGTISNAFARCSVVASSLYAGGLVGSADSGSLFADAYASGNVTSDSIAGGLIGLINSSTIRRCYAVGAVAATSEAGGLIGQALLGSPVDSYWDTQTSGLASSAGGEGKPTAEMKQQTTFTDWDFADVWRIDEGVDYPRLRVFDPAVSSSPPDAWLIRFYGSVAAAPEVSVKGDPLLWEYIAGTDPTDSDSLFAVTGADNVSGTVAMQFNSVTGRVYRLLSTPSLEVPAWQPIGTASNGTGAPITFDTPAPATRTFYRIGVELAD